MLCFVSRELGVIVAGAVFFGLLHLMRAKRTLKRWADHNGFEDY